jgi:hypothetical protein
MILAVLYFIMANKTQKLSAEHLFSLVEDKKYK